MPEVVAEVHSFTGCPVPYVKAGVQVKCGKEGQLELIDSIHLSGRSQPESPYRIEFVLRPGPRQGFPVEVHFTSQADAEVFARLILQSLGDPVAAKLTKALAENAELRHKIAAIEEILKGKTP